MALAVRMNAARVASLTILGSRKLGENSPCCLAVIELGQNHLTVDRDVPMDRPQVFVHLEYVMVDAGVLVDDQVDHHLRALTRLAGHVVHLGSILRTAPGFGKTWARDVTDFRRSLTRRVRLSTAVTTSVW
jgi:hypothetical protein